jgi:O-antigen ligase
VFSSLSATTSLTSRARGIILGTIIVVAVPACLVSAKTIQIFLPVLLVAAIVAAVYSGEAWRTRAPLSNAAVGLIALLGYAAISSLWAPFPQQALLISGLGMLIAVGSLTLAQLCRTEQYQNKLHMREGLWIGLLVGVGYSAAEAASDQAIKIWVYNLLQLQPGMLEPARYFTRRDGHLIAVHTDDLKRNAFPIPLLLWPGLLALTTLRTRTQQVAMGCALVGLSTFAVLFSTGQTNILALIAGCLAYLFAAVWHTGLRACLAAAWLAATLLIVPIAHLLRALDMQNSEWLQLSAQLRIVIWGRIADLVSASPWFGTGAGMTYYLTPAMGGAPDAWIDDVGFNIAHPHNVYLQVWYELGAVGAGLFAVLGLVLLREIGRLPSTQQPAVFALFAAAATAITSSYNIWQIWLMCLFGFVFAMVALTQREQEL